ncbi:MAG TPA: trypsin-like peptidase domain-containing protein [Chloroflexia bacterium]|nr:trypsin-like peptidase domain-containing protein [Chloroflexia bacterium]
MERPVRPVRLSAAIFNRASKRLARLLGSVLVISLLMLGLAACGNSTTTGSQSGSTSATTAAATGGATTAATTTVADTSSAASPSAVASTVAGAAATPEAMVSTTTPNSTATSSSNSTTSSSNTTGPAPSGNLETDVKSVVDTVKSAVVLIAVSTPQAQGVGTGSILTPDGYIVTNFHVVAADNASVAPQTKIQVVMTDGKKYPATVSGTDRSNDLAVIKIDATGLPTIKLGSSGNLSVGQWVVAVGNALALPGGPTVTAGIVSALGRSIQEPAPASAYLTSLIQTSAAINPGNSGGPLLNLNGEIVGINTAAPVDPQSQSAAQGIGFAISIDQAKPIIQTLEKGQSIYPPYLGILPETLTPGLATQFNLPTNSGILIRQVGPGTPAAQAGWKAGDTLTELDGTQITSLQDLQGVLNKHKPGDSVSFTVVTPQGQNQKGNITFGQPPSQ